MRRYKMTVRRRSKDEPWGRFGGGWQWNVGVQASENFNSIIVNLLTFSVRFSLVKK